MRQWNVPPKLMCRQHLLGEHLEVHMFVTNLREGRPLNGFVANGLLEVHTLKKRHQQLVWEMKRRGYKHKSRLPAVPKQIRGKIDWKVNLRVLASRCEECRRRQNENNVRSH